MIVIIIIKYIDRIILCNNKLESEAFLSLALASLL